MQQLILYSTLGCHLCETALDEIDHCLTLYRSGHHFQISEVDIADDPNLLKEYGVSIPVLFFPTEEKKLYWPFDSTDVARLLKLGHSQ